MSLGSAWRTFWHSMTSNDRHASHDSPFRTGQHVPLPQSRHAPLTSVATNAVESRTDLSSPSTADVSEGSNPYGRRGSGNVAPGTPYSPGMRSEMQRTQSDDNATTLKGGAKVGEIQMQAFSDGLPPPPPVNHSWKRIDRWAEDNYEELHDQLGEGCTQNDINELEHELDCTLPMEVRESLQIHDGQERGGRPTGIIFGCMLLDCEEIVQEWRNWRVVNDEFLAANVTMQTPQFHNKAFDGASSSSSPQAAQRQDTRWKEDLMSRQDSQPVNAIQKVYSSISWIPLARDWGGNNLAVDLAPGPAGRWGQVILMGRDYDCKYVVARSWGAFLAILADDLGSSKWFVNEESGELKLREFKQQNVEPPYLDILRWRTDQKYGRRALRKRPGPNGDLKINSPGQNPAARVSPYASPVTADSERGRSPQRFPAKGLSVQSPLSASSPLSRVTEENGVAAVGPSLPGTPTKKSRPATERLVSTGTSRDSIDSTTTSSTLPNAPPSGKENAKKDESTSGLGMQNIDLEETKSGVDESRNGVV